MFSPLSRLPCLLSPLFSYTVILQPWAMSTQIYMNTKCCISNRFMVQKNVKLNGV